MPRARSPNRDKAYLLWKSSKGKKKSKDIASELGVSESLISRWKKEDDWLRKSGKKFTNRKSKVKPKKTTEKKENKTIKNKIIKSLEENDELTENQKLFCFFLFR